MSILEDGSARQEVARARSRTIHTPGKYGSGLLLCYRWLIFLFSAVLCITGAGPAAKDYAIFWLLALAAVYNVVVTACTLRNERKLKLPVLYLDIIILMVLTFFSGGIKSDLYVFLFFVIGLCSTSDEIGNTIKAGIVSTVLYIVTCIFYGRLYGEAMSYATLGIRGALFLMAAFAISRVNCEVRKYEEMRKREFRLARTDKLTGLANRHYLEQKLKEEAEYACKEGSMLSILIFDLDNFKSFNDTFGHVSGDKLLVLFSDIIRQCVRKSDIPIRYGGEEFMVLIRELDILLAKSVADRIRRQLEKQRIYIGNQNGKKQMTVSCGVAQFPMHSGSIKEVIEKADQALYYAKEIGKNIVVCYDEIGRHREALVNEPLE